MKLRTDTPNYTYKTNKIGLIMPYLIGFYILLEYTYQ